MPPSHRLRVSTWLITTVILLSGCQAAPRPVPPPPAPGPAEVPVTIKSEPAAAAFWVPPDVPLTADLPTYPAEPAAPLGETEIPRGGPDSLRRIAGALEATGAPGTAAGNDARYIGSMAGGRYVYLLTVEPGLYAPTAYIVQHGAGGWTAEPICQAPPSVWFWPSTAAMQSDPVLICAHTEGSDSILTVEAYESGRLVLIATGLHQGTLTVRDRPGAPPDLMLTGGRIWLANHLEPQVTERFTLTWQEGGYRLTRHERMADETYHLARLTALVAKGDYARAEAEFAPGGLQAYLTTHAPHFPEAAAGTVLSTRGYKRYLAAGVQGSGHWFHYDFAADGRLAILEETAPQ